MMDHLRFQEILENMDWSYAAAARALDINQVTISRWARGKNPIPEPLGEHLEALDNALARARDTKPAQPT